MSTHAACKTSMELFDRTLGRSGREVLYRPIEFERYRKPHIVEYPRHAVVLNPHHTSEQRKRQEDDHMREEDDDELGGERDNESDGGDEGDEDGDPWRANKSTFLCGDEALKQCLHLRWRNVGAVGVGLQNMGNTCFANSVLQAIAYTPALAQYFATTFKAADTQLGAPHDFAFALGEVVRHVHLGRGGGGPSAMSAPSHHRGDRAAAYRPTPVVGHLRALSKHFSIGKQSDAHEFAVQLLHACQRSILFRLVGSKKLPPAVAQTTALNRICGGYLRSQVSWSRRDEVQQLNNAGKKQEAMDLTMAGQHQRGGRGAEDPDRLVSNTYDPNIILNVEIAGNRLEHCLERFCEAEKLDGRCYLSPRDVNVRATKQFRIHVPPNVLIIQLKRFTATGGKIGKHVQFPKLLDVTPFCSETAVTRAAGGRYTYELNAVCVHEGGSLNYGHYYAAVRARNGTWYECNDAHVGTLSEDAVMRLPAYMLFYSRVVTKAVETSAAASPLAPTARAHRPSAAPAGERSGPRLTATPMALEMELGKELTEDEVQALLRSRSRQSTASSSIRHTTDDLAGTQLKTRSNDGEEDEDDATEGETAGTRQSTQRQQRQSMKRAREALPTDSDDDGEDADEDGNAHPQQRSSQTSAGTSPSLSARDGAGPTEKLIKKGRYGGIIKAMTYHRTPASTDATETGKAYRVGRHAVSAITHRVAESTPSSVRRPANAPMFQQKMRDVLWEMEMDKGRVKKVKTRRGEGGTTEDAHDGGQINRFQRAGENKFDVRGRPLRKGLE